MSHLRDNGGSSSSSNSASRGSSSGQHASTSASSSSSSTSNSSSTTLVTLNIKTLDASTHSVSIQLTQKVTDLKQLLQNKLDVPTSRQRLICRGQLMRDDKTLKDYGLEDGHTLHLVTRPEDAPPANQRNDEPRGGFTTTFGAGPSTNPFRFTPGEYQVSIIGVDGDADPQSYQQIVQALADSFNMGADASPPTVIRVDGDLASRSPFPGFPTDYIWSLPSRGRDGNGVSTGNSGSSAARRSSFLTRRAVPRGHSLPHLPTIEAELTRAAAQLRNVHTILAQPDSNHDNVELESLDVPHLESVHDNVDGDVVDVTAVSALLHQLSDANRTMANHLERLSSQFQRSPGPTGTVDHSALQQASVRTARAMYRLASVQNTVFPMLANASFERSGDGSSNTMNYRYLPSRSWPRPEGGTSGARTEGLPTAPRATTTPLAGGPRRSSFTGNMGGRTSGGSGGPFTSARATILPISAVMGPTVATGLSFNNASAGLIPSIVAHARATARSVQAQAAQAGQAATANGSSSTSSSSSARSSNNAATTMPVGMLTRGVDGNLSYTTQSPPSYASTSLGDAALAEMARTGFMDFWRQYGEQGSNGPSTGTTGNNTANTGSSSSRTVAAVAAARAADTAALTTEAAAAAVHRASLALDTAIASSLLQNHRRRNRPEDFLMEALPRPATRRRLSDSQGEQRSISDMEESIQRAHEFMAGYFSRAPTNGNHASTSSTNVTANRPAAISTTSTTTSNSSAATTTTSPRRTSPAPPPQPTQVSRSNSNDSRRIPTSPPGAVSPTTVSPGSSSPPTVSTPTQGTGLSSSPSGQQQSMGSPAYNLGRIGVFISALLRMVDQPREDGSPRTLADVVCNDADNRSTLLQDLITSISESVTIRETRLIVEGYPAPLRNLHPVFNTFIREKALAGRQLTEENMDSIAVMLANGILNAVDFEEILESLSPSATIEISASRIREMSAQVLCEHFRRLIYMVVAVPLGRESSGSSTFARDLILWIRDVVGAWRVAFYGLYPERDHSEAQRIATHVVGSAIHANGRRWVELSNRATNTLVNVLCANIVPRRRGEEQAAGGLVGGAWPLMATTSRNRRTCIGSSLLGSTAPPYASPSSSSSHQHSSSQSRASSSSSSSSTFSTGATGPLSSLGTTLVTGSSGSSSPSSSSSSLASNLEWTRPLSGETPAETQDRIMHRVKQAFMAGESMPPQWTTPSVLQAFMSGDVQGAIQMALAATPQDSSSCSSNESPINQLNDKEEKNDEGSPSSSLSSSKKLDHRTRVEDASDEEMP